MADLTPELLAQLEDGFRKWASAEGLRFQEADRIYRLFVGAAPALVAAVKERDQLREAARLREHATLEAWSGSLVGIEAAEAASARAAALEALAGIESPATAEQQLDAALTKLGAALLGGRKLRAEVERLRRLGIEAVECVEASCSMTMPAPVERIRAEIEREP